jgi:hypothetical protein
MDVFLYPVLAVFAIFLAGLLCVRFGYLSRDMAYGVLRYGFAIAIPVYVFRSMVSAGLPKKIDDFFEILGSYYIGAVLVMVLGMVVAKFVFQSGAAEQRALGIGSSHSSAVLLGVPAVLLIFGRYNQGLTLVIGLHAVLMPLIVVLVSGIAARKFGGIAKTVVASLSRQWKNPILVGMILGIAFKMIGWEIPSAIDNILLKVSDSAVAVLLFGSGGVLAAYRLGGDLRKPAVVSALKLIVHPLLVWVLATQVFTIPIGWVWVAVMLAAMPTSMGMEMPPQKAGGDAAGTAVALSTVAALLTIIVITYALRAG